MNLSKISGVSPYRPDVDGLRAVAVLLVILYHAFPRFLSGGYVGVDVFFCISGYLITNHIYHDLNESKFSILNFYSKRILRIFPSLVLILFFTVVFGWYALLPDDFQSLGKHVASGMGFVSNIVLWNESGYFDQSASSKPLLHLWSLGIEEQFYIFLPLILMAISVYRPAGRLKALMLLFIASLLLNLFLAPRLPTADFYLLPTRFWELLAGGMLAILEKEKPDGWSEGVFSRNLKKIGKNGWFAIGLLLILFGAFKFDANDRYPGWRALYPIAGTILILLTGQTSKWSRKILGHQWMVFIGLISYPLYLWHWPILVFARDMFPRAFDANFRVQIFCIFLAAGLSVLTYLFWERPIRTIGRLPHRRRIIVGALTGFSIVVLILGWGIYVTNGIPARLPMYAQLKADMHPNIESYSGARARECKNAYVDKICADNERVNDCKNMMNDLGFCDSSDLGKPPTIALLGDSHANHYFIGLNSYFKSQNENVLLLGLSSTVPFVDTITLRDDPTPAEPLIDFVINTKSIHTVILAGFWNAYFSENMSDDQPKIKIRRKSDGETRDQNKLFKELLEKTVGALVAANKKIIFIHDIPFFKYLKSCLPKPYRPTINSTCEVVYSDFLRVNGSYRAIADEVLLVAGAKIIDPGQTVCIGNKCFPYNGNTFLYFDEQHLGSAGSKLIIENGFRNLRVR